MNPLGYFVLSGVRRCLATREAGRPAVPVAVVVSGRPDVHTRLTLAELFTTKSTVPRDARYLRNSYHPTVVLGTEPPGVEVEPVYDANRLKRLTPIPAVLLV
jgi:hypothetical protein